MNRGDGSSRHQAVSGRRMEGELYTTSVSLILPDPARLAESVTTLREKKIETFFIVRPNVEEVKHSLVERCGS